MVPPTLLPPVVDLGEGQGEAVEARCREEIEILGSKVVGKTGREEPSDGATDAAAATATNDDDVVPNAIAGGERRRERFSA